MGQDIKFINSGYVETVVLLSHKDSRWFYLCKNRW